LAIPIWNALGSDSSDSYWIYFSTPTSLSRSWLSQYAASRKVFFSILDVFFRIFRWPIPGRTMVFWSTQPLTEMNTRVICCCVGLTTLPLSCVDFLEILGAWTSWKPKGLYRDSLTLHQ
jgi:hypothetical protein